MDADNQSNLIDLSESTDTQKQPPSNSKENAEPADSAEQSNVMDIIGNGQLVKKVCG